MSRPALHDDDPDVKCSVENSRLVRELEDMASSLMSKMRVLAQDHHSLSENVGQQRVNTTALSGQLAEAQSRYEAEIASLRRQHEHEMAMVTAADETRSREGVVQSQHLAQQLMEARAESEAHRQRALQAEDALRRSQQEAHDMRVEITRLQNEVVGFKKALGVATHQMQLQQESRELYRSPQLEDPLIARLRTQSLFTEHLMPSSHAPASGSTAFSSVVPARVRGDVPPRATPAATMPTSARPAESSPGRDPVAARLEQVRQMLVRDGAKSAATLDAAPRGLRDEIYAVPGGGGNTSFQKTIENMQAFRKYLAGNAV